MSRGASLLKIGNFGADIQKDAALFEGAVAQKMRQDALTAYGPFNVTDLQTSTYTARPWDFVRCDPRAGTFSVLLPDANSADAGAIIVKNDSASATTITIQPLNTTCTIARTTSKTIAVAGGCMVLHPNRARNDWMVSTSSTGIDTAATLGQILRFDGTVWAPVEQSTTGTLSGASNTFALTDRFKYLAISHTSATTATVPPNSSVAFPTGTILQGYQSGAGQVTFAQGAGVTIRTAETLKLRKQYSSFALVKIATDEWVLTGDLELA